MCLKMLASTFILPTGMLTVGETLDSRDMIWQRIRQLFATTSSPRGPRNRESPPLDYSSMKSASKSFSLFNMLTSCSPPEFASKAALMSHPDDLCVPWKERLFTPTRLQMSPYMREVPGILIDTNSRHIHSKTPKSSRRMPSTPICTRLQRAVEILDAIKIQEVAATSRPCLQLYVWSKHVISAGAEAVGPVY